MNNDIGNIYDETIDVIIKFAGTRAADRIFDEIDASMSDDDILFSDKHIEAINGILIAEKNKIKKRKHNNINKRILLTAIIVIITFLISVLTVSAFREKIINFFMEVTYLGTVFHYESEIEEQTYEFAINIKYIPEGFEQSQEYTNSNERFARYIKGEQYFDVSKQIVPYTYAINTEDANIKNIDVNDINVFYSNSDKLKTMTWVKNGYLYTVSGNIDEGTLIDIVKNVF